MRKLRFNIANLLALILVLGVGFAALRESSDFWESGLFTVTLDTLLTSILLAVHRTESKRAFWLGFAIFGWAYMGLSVMPSIESRLITTKVLAYLDSKVPGRPLEMVALQITETSSGSPSDPVQSAVFAIGRNQLVTTSQGLWIQDVTTGKLRSGWSGTTENFVRIGHSLFALLVGWLGGHLSRRLYRASRHTEVSTAVESGGNNP